MDYIKKAEEVFSYMRGIHRTPVIRDLNGISQGEMAALAYLTFEQDGVSAGELTEAFDIGTSRTAAILNALTRKGLARREQDQEDGRKVLVYVTEAGRQEVKQKREEIVSDLAEFLKLIGPEDTETFLRIIRNAINRNAFGSLEEQS